MSILITGGTGFIGSGLAHELVGRGDDIILFDIAPRVERVEDIKDEIKVVQGDLGVWPEVLNVVKENKVESIFHLGAMLSLPADENPWASFYTNVMGTLHVLEAARLFGVKHLVFASSTATYGLGTTGVITDETLQRPITTYGAEKLYGELLGRFYRRKFGLDFRCLRYCPVMGPGIKSRYFAVYNSWMVENAALGKPFESFVAEDAAIPLIYFKDAIRAIEMLHYSSREQIRTVCYNVSGVSPAQSAKELELAIKKSIPRAKITYKPNHAVMELFRSQNIRVVDDHHAREEWGWEPLYTDFEKVVGDFIQEMRIKGNLDLLA